MSLASLVRVVRLGGKSTGKSLLLQNLAARHKGKVRRVPKFEALYLGQRVIFVLFLVDQVFLVKLRRHGTILSGLIRVLPQPISLEKLLTFWDSART